MSPHDGRGVRCVVPFIPSPQPRRSEGETLSVFGFFLHSRERGAPHAATPPGHHIRVKSQMRLDFQSEGGCIDVFVGSHRESRATPRRWGGALSVASPHAPRRAERRFSFWFWLFFLQLWLSRPPAAATRWGAVHSVLIKTQMRLDFPSGRECSNSWLESHRASRMHARQEVSALLGGCVS